MLYSKFQLHLSQNNSFWLSFEYFNQKTNAIYKFPWRRSDEAKKLFVEIPLVLIPLSTSLDEFFLFLFQE